MLKRVLHWYIKDKIRVILYTPLILIILLKCWMIIDNTPSGEKLLSGGFKQNLMERRAYLIDRLERGYFSADSMPSVGRQFQYEWGLVNISMTAAALTNMAFTYPETRESAIAPLEQLVELALSEEYRDLGNITWEIDPLADLESQPAQAWYIAHASMTIAAYKYATSSTTYDSIYTAMHNAIVRTIDECEIPYIQTYPYETYSADNSTLYAALKLHDRLMGSSSDTLIQKWVAYTKSDELDKNTGLIKSYIEAPDAPFANSRGSWVGWMSNYLPFIDKELAKEQYLLAKKHHGDRVLGFQVLREYPHGVDEKGDIDSGPVILGASISGTCFIIGGAVWHKDTTMIEDLIFLAEVAGNSWSSKGRREYLSSPLVGDGAMVAMLTWCDWDLRYQ